MPWGKGPRRVRTAQGAKLFGQPIGTVITADMIERAKKGMGVAQGAREAFGMTDRRRGKRPVRGVVSSEVRRVAGTGKKGRKPKGLPEGHRYFADKHEERKARYLESIRSATTEEDLSAILDVLEADKELDDEKHDSIVDDMAARLDVIRSGAAPKDAKPEKPEAAPEVQAVPEAQATPKPTTEDKPAADKDRLGNAKKKPSATHKKQLMSLVRSAQEAKQLKIIERRAEGWHEDGYLDDKAYADILASIETKRKRIPMSSPKDRKDEETFVSGYIESPDRTFNDLADIKVHIDMAFDEEKIGEAERDSLMAKLHAKAKELDPNYEEGDELTHAPFAPGEVDVEDAGDFTSEERTTLINPKDVDFKGHEEYLEGLRGDPSSTPAGKALAAGGKIEDLTDPEGLEQYVRANPDRFETNDISGGMSGSDVFSVHDKEHDTTYFFKRATNNGAVGSTGDGINEVLCGKLGVSAFPDLFLDCDFAERPEHGGNPLIRMTHIDERAKEVGSDIVFYDSSVREAKPKFADRKQVVALHIFDFLTNQNDRHDGNVGWVQGKDGLHIVPTDNGNAFNAYNTYLFEMDPGAFDPEVVTAPEVIGYEDWADMYMVNPDGDEFFNKERNIAIDIHNAYGKAHIDEFTADVRSVVEQFKSVDIDAIIDDLHKRFPNMDAYERLHLEAAAAIWKNRVSFITEDPDFEMTLASLITDAAKSGY